MQKAKNCIEPVSNPELDTVDIDLGLFSIGRSEPYFSKLPSAVSAKLSRRHARIFIEEGHAYVTDLNSRNGTRINGRALEGGRPEIIRTDDEIEFAGVLLFRVKLGDSAQQIQHVDQEHEHSQLILKPVSQENTLDTIVVSDFPFFIGRKHSVFEHYAEKIPAELMQLSRRHALITLQAGDFLIAELGSKNGTEINGKKLDETATSLVNGDTIAFGGDHFVYRVVLPELALNDEKPAIATDVESTGSESNEHRLATPVPELIEERTMFVDSPTSFLDIFCSDEEQDQELPQSDDAAGAERNNREDGQPGKLGMARQQAREIGQAFKGETRLKAKKIRPVAIVVMLLVAALAVYLFYPSDRKRIAELSANEQYRKSATLANNYLASKPSDTQVQTLGVKALLHFIVPNWTANIQAGDFSAASALITAAQTNFSNIDEATEYLQLLQWATRLQQFSHESGGSEGPIDIFDDEIQMDSLLREWNQQPNANLQLLAQLSAQFPEFSGMQKQTLSHLRKMRHSYSLYGKAIDELSITAINSIDSADMPTLLAEIEDYKKNYPRLAGLDALIFDAETFESSSNKLEHADLGTLIEIQSQLSFKTRLFDTHASPYFASRLPDPDVINAYQSALLDWRSGNADAAIDTLKQLEHSNPWYEQVSMQIQRFKRVSDDYNALGGMQDSPDQMETLLAFRRLLKPSEDSWYIESTRPNFERYKDMLVVQLDSRYESAREQWQKYLVAGGITSVMRIEDPVSRKYRSQAQLLANSFAGMHSVVDDYSNLQLAPTPQISSLYVDIDTEIKRQRSWISDLGVVIDDRLLHSKLALLPYLTDEQL